MPIRAILFDADGVLQYATDDFEQRIEAVLGFLPSPIEDFKRDVFAAERPTLTGGNVVEALGPVMTRWGAAGRAEPLVRSWWTSIVVDSGVVGLIGQLRASGYLCALATNQQSLRADYMRSQLGYDEVFDRCFYSCDVGLAKPDADYFRNIADALTLAPAELFFVDDHERNVAGARAAGLVAERFVNNRTTLAAGELRTLLLASGVTLTG
ncbi:MAG: HAD-IA family hydrolase [Myxococcales bacterium]|nr:HAD-IA family hydrolase [Myxococcales bacterium]MDD9966525.1 HAD-IA family hydrolase [Myxococcales bacterium]